MSNSLQIEFENFKLSIHAQEKARKHNISYEAINTCLQHGEITSNGKGYWKFRLGALDVVVRRGGTIVAVDWKGHEWNFDYNTWAEEYKKPTTYAK